MLRPDTQRLWERLRPDPAFAGCVLIGGTALSLHFAHRLSEDLDLAYVGLGATPDLRLPRRRLGRGLDRLRAEGFTVEANDDQGAVEEFEIGGQDLYDYQQDYVVGGVKLSIFTPDDPLRRVVRPGVGVIRVASVDELFRSKALASAGRSKTRDWFDLYHLMTVGGYNFDDFHRAFLEARAASTFDTALTRLCSGQPHADDEGYESLLPDPPTLAQITTFFVNARREWEIRVASALLPREADPPQPPELAADYPPLPGAGNPPPDTSGEKEGRGYGRGR